MAKDCIRSKIVRADCDTCGQRPDMLHMPTKRRGWFCGDHCPVCSPKPTATAKDPKIQQRPILAQA